MAVFAVVYRYVDRPDELAEHRPAHREYLRSLHGPNGLIAAGRADGGSQPSGVLLFNADSKETIERMLDADPFWTKNLIESRDIMEWTVAIGSIGLDGEE